MKTNSAIKKVKILNQREKEGKERTKYEKSNIQAKNAKTQKDDEVSFL